ncbi:MULTISPECIES: hypothetical protein [Corynebacterium]|uniref:hypothetical protein n=1 Tax=Corynebacterium TaxID=1716 RepID=UPI0008356D98|nr:MULTISPECIES: hypothetical protein [Corynebacterium]
MPNPDIRWAPPSDGHTFPIYAGPVADMERVGEFSVERDTATLRFAGDTWQLEAGKGPVMRATTSPDTGSQVFTATGDGESFGRSTNVLCTVDRHQVVIHRESRKEYVILDASGRGGPGQEELDLQKAPKVGQFSAESGALKKLHVEFEGAGQSLPLDAQVFISWVARHAIESRMISSTWAMTLFLVILIPLILLYLLNVI